ncbi:MAG: nucleotidyl transferase AbiEii/AbiGii toxin family protein [Thermoleophilia bacterium]
MAAAEGVDLLTVDLDYALGWLLAGLFLEPEVRDNWVFKGGTSLRKCWFPEYRFSEDLNFTVIGSLELEDVKNLLGGPIEAASRLSGIDLMAAEPRFEVDTDEYGSETVKVRLYHRSTIDRSGSPQAVRIHLSSDEVIALPVTRRSLDHPYSDVPAMPALEIPCYCLEEILAEKLRAVGGQRRFAIARDVFDINHLLTTEVDIDLVFSILSDKFAVKQLTIHPVMVDAFVQRRADYRMDWHRRVEHLETGELTNFDAAFQTVAELLGRIVEWHKL